MKEVETGSVKAGYHVNEAAECVQINGLPVHSIYEMLLNLEDQYQDKIAMRWVGRDRHSLEIRTYRDFVGDVRRCAAYLSRNFAPIEGKHIGILAENSYEYLVALFGIIISDAVIVFLNHQEPVSIVGEEMERADIDFVFSDGLYEEIYPEFAEERNHIIVPLESWKSMPEFAGLPWIPKQEEDQLSAMMFTSGTTSASKCVMISQGNLMAAIPYASDMVDGVHRCLKEENLSAFHMMPMYHITGLISAMIWLIRGNTMSLCSNMQYLYRDLALMPSDYTFAVPMLLKIWKNDILHGRKDRLGNLKLIYSGGAVVEESLARFFMEHGILLAASYGMTELTGFAAYNLMPETGRYDVLGRPGVGVEVRIMGGEICARSKMVTLGYYKEPQLTAETFVDGWVHTGDMGYMDEEGYVHMTGRKKNLIILSNGENVSPEELESYLQESPQILEVVVRGVNDRICAEIYCEEQDRETIEEYIEEVNDRLPSYKWIQDLVFRKEGFPRTASGKIRR